MTIKELYEWGMAHNIEDYNICVQYRDAGGEYPGQERLADCESECHINKKAKEVIL